jgi:serine-type D-Ala-D-Ala carboxypeptidase (penicillin-binding protein 5/6)
MTFNKIKGISAKSFILIDYNTGTIIAQKDSNSKRNIASITKLMTSYIIFDYINKGLLNLDDEVLVSQNAYTQSGSRMFIEIGTLVKIEDLLKGLIIHSGNDASIALAEKACGSEEQFVILMNTYAKKLGLKNSKFINPSGLPSKLPNEVQFMSASDIVTLSRSIIKDFPNFQKYFNQKEFEYNNIKQLNKNKLLWNNDYSIDGLKTGFTKKAGYCLVCSATQNNMKLISVILNTDKILRFKDSKKVLDYGFNFYTTKKIITPYTPVMSIAIPNSNKPTHEIYVKSSLYMTIQKGVGFEFEFEPKKDLSAPLNKNEYVGKILIIINENNENNEKIDAYVKEYVDEQIFLLQIFNKIIKIISG